MTAEWAAYTSIPAMIVGIPGNILVIALVIYFQHLHEPFFVFLSTLCGANLIMVAFMVPLTAHGMVEPSSLNDAGLCQVAAHLNWFGAGAAFLCILMCVLDRYFAIVWHSYYKNKLGKCMTIIMIVVSFLLPVFLLLPSTVQNNGEYHLDLSRCVISIREETAPVRNAVIAVVFAIPAIVILYCFIHIFYHVKSKQKRILAGGERTPDELMRLRTYFNHEARLAKMALVVSIYYVVTYLPDAVASAYERSGLAVLVHILWLISAYGFACYPFLYCLNEEFREIYKQVFCIRELKQIRSSARDSSATDVIVNEGAREHENHVSTVSENVDVEDVRPSVRNTETTL